MSPPRRTHSKTSPSWLETNVLSKRLKFIKAILPLWKHIVSWCSYIQFTINLKNEWNLATPTQHFKICLRCSQQQCGTAFSEATFPTSHPQIHCTNVRWTTPPVTSLASIFLDLQTSRNRCCLQWGFINTIVASLSTLLFQYHDMLPGSVGPLSGLNADTYARKQIIWNSFPASWCHGRSFIHPQDEDETQETASRQG